jgi:hypothetical protein
VRGTTTTDNTCLHRAAAAYSPHSCGYWWHWHRSRLSARGLSPRAQHARAARTRRGRLPALSLESKRNRRSGSQDRRTHRSKPFFIGCVGAISLLVTASVDAGPSRRASHSPLAERRSPSLAVESVSLTRRRERKRRSDLEMPGGGGQRTAAVAPGIEAAYRCRCNPASVLTYSIYNHSSHSDASPSPS